MENLEKITVKTLPTWDQHEDYPELTFVLNDSAPWCESCNQVDYGTPVCMTHSSWCLNCIGADTDIISKEDVERIWIASEDYIDDKKKLLTKEEFIDWFRKESDKIEPETEDFYETFSLTVTNNQLDELYDLIKG
jgi:hypothetical protein